MINDIVCRSLSFRSTATCKKLISTSMTLSQIDWEESRIQTGRICVKNGVNGDLDELRRTYHGLPSFLVRTPLVYPAASSSRADVLVRLPLR